MASNAEKASVERETMKIVAKRSTNRKKKE